MDNNKLQTPEDSYKQLRELLSEELKMDSGTEDFVKVLRKFRWYMTLYHCSIREVRTKFEVLNDELSITHERNPIQSIYSRVKTPESIFGKMRRMGVPFSVESMNANLNDIAGVRIICQYIDDIYTVAEMLGRQDDINILTVKDYIKNPKPNGYRSYHMIVEVPVFFSKTKNIVRVEVQLRTIAMDFWATLEHGMKYKREVKDADRIVAELKDCAEQVYALDTRMQELKERIRTA